MDTFTRRMIPFEPEYTFEQFTQRIHSIAEATREELAPEYAAKMRLSRMIAACILLLNLVMIVFPAGKQQSLSSLFALLSLCYFRIKKRPHY